MGFTIMVGFSNAQDLRTELLAIKKQKVQVEQEMHALQKPPVGTADINFYRMKKQKSALQEKITRINSILRPDIIA